MKLAFYKANRGNWLDAAINLLSGGAGFSHVELVFSNGVSYSSTSRDGDGSTCYADGRPKPDGTRFKWINYDPEKWHVTNEIAVPPAAEDAIRAFCVAEIDCRYDFDGCLRFAAPFLRQDPERWFCSEVCLAALQSAGFWQDYEPWRYSPNALAKLLGVIDA